MSAEEIFLKEFGSKKRLDYYRKTFGLKTTKDILIFDYGRTLYGSSNSHYKMQCHPSYVYLEYNNTCENYGWEWIADLIDGGCVQLSLWG